MADKKKAKKKAAKPEPVSRKERRFAAAQNRSSLPSSVAGMAGALALGAGVYAQWVQAPPLPWAQYLVAGGALTLGAALWFSEVSGDPIRVGAVGVAVEHGSEFTRIAWCDLTRIAIEGKHLLLESEDATLSVSLGLHPQAVAWILKEGVLRVPDAMDVKGRDSDGLPEPQDSDGALVPVESLQIAGRHCAATDNAISFERDARLCPNCAQVYHREHTPQKCVTCGEELAGRAYAP